MRMLVTPYRVLIAMALVSVIASALVLSPFIITKKIDGFEHIQITDVGDYYKHTFMVSAIATTGIPPQNPYFPKSKMTYYYGYYVIPALITKIFSVPAHLSFYWYSLLTNFVSLLLPALIINSLVKKPIYKYLAYGLVLTGVGVDTIPFVFDTAGQLQNSEGLQLISVYKSLLFVPQHLFAASLTAWIIFQLINKKISAVALAALTAMVFLSSMFVAITLVIGLVLYFLFHKQKIFLIKAGLISLPVLIPYLLLIKGRGNLISPYLLDPYNFNGIYLMDILYTFWLKYGPFILAAPLFLIFTKGYSKLLAFGMFILLAMTWVFRSPIFNDFSMRTSIPIWLTLPGLLFHLVEKSKNRRLHIFLIGLSLITLLIGLKGVYWEFSKHYKDRTFLKPHESELILKLRELPKGITLSSVEKSQVIEYIPSLTGKTITSPYLFDSYVYFADGFGREHGEYERWADQTFHKEVLSSDIQDNIKQKNTLLAEIKDGFSKYPTDKFLLTNKLWVKKDTNPWLVILKEIGIKHDNLTPHYTLFDYQDLLEKLSEKSVVIDENSVKEIKISDHGFELPKGLSYLISCKSHTDTYVRLELNDYYTFFDKTLNNGSLCAGKLFYLEQAGRVTFTPDSSTDNLYLAPVHIEPIVLE